MVIRTNLQLKRSAITMEQRIDKILEQRQEQLLIFNTKNKLPVILQTEATECGLVCLAMIAGFYGFNTDIVSLRSRFSVSNHGLTLKAVIDIASRMNLSTRALKLDIDQIERLQFPCVLHWDMNHFVVLKSIKKNKIHIHDPANGERVYNHKEFAEHFTGVALELTPTHEFKKGEEIQKLGLNHFWSRILGLKRSLIQVLILSLLLQVFAVISPFYMQLVIDDVIINNNSNLLYVLALGFGLLLLIQTGTSAVRQLVIIQLSNALNIQMAANLFRHLIRLPMDYFSKRHMGEIVSRFGSLDNVRQLITTGLVSALVDGLMASITLAVMFYYDSNLAWVVVIIVMLYASLRLALYRPLRLLTEEAIIAKAKHDSHFMESVRAIQTIKLFQRENDRQGEWQNRLADNLNKNIRISQWNLWYDIANRLLFGIENILVIYIAATSVMNNLMSVGMLYAFMSYKNRFVQSMDSLIKQWIDIKMLGLHLDRLADITYTDMEDVDSHNSEHSDHSDIVTGKIEVKNLSYRYGEADRLVFNNVSFIIEPGETVAITGISGCGKSTLLKCIMGLLKPTDGQIFIDNQPIEHCKHYRNQIAAVMQDDQLMSGSIADNIASFSPQIDLKKVQQSARFACIDQEIETMPMAYNTLVGDMGTSLSGGQKQRIVLARALYRKPSILFMDEATSHLDVTNESLVNSNIQKLKITRLIVAHRPETVNSAERKIEIIKTS